MRTVWFALSLTVVLAGLAKMGVNHGRAGMSLAFGIDFTGGAAYTLKFETPPGGKDSAAQSTAIRNAIEGIKTAKGESLKHASIQIFADGGVQIRTATGSDPQAPTSQVAAEARAEGDQVLQALRGKFGNVELVGSDLVGPVIGEHLRNMAYWALFWGNLLILIFVAMRYNVKGVGGGYLFGLCAVIALIHDVLVMVGVYAWTNTEVNSNFVAAVLTVVGYSVNDTVIIFDRVRENMGKLDTAQRRNITLVEEVIETSLWQVMDRSLITVFATLLPLIMLFLFGGVTIKDFALALIIGIVSGCYSSIFNAPVLFAVFYRWMLKRGESRGAWQAPVTRARPTSSRPRPGAEGVAAGKPKGETTAPAAGASRLRERPVAETSDSPEAPEAPAGEDKKRPTGAGGTKRKRRH